MSGLIQLTESGQFVDVGTYFGEFDYQACAAAMPTEASYIKIMGKEVALARRIKVYGRDFPFTNSVQRGHPLEEAPWLTSIMTAASELYGIPFNTALVNWYRDGNDYIGAHSDNEAPSVPGTPIVCFTFGASRPFIMRNKQTKQIVATIPTVDHGMITMKSGCQQLFTHEIPKCSARDAAAMGMRVSITLRQFK